MQPFRKAWVGMIVWLLIGSMWLNDAPTMTQAAQLTFFQSRTRVSQAQVNSSLDLPTNLTATHPLTGTWQTGFNDLAFSNGTITTVISDAVGNWYFGGNFSQIGGVAVNNIARWDGTAWSSLSTTTPDWANWNYQVSTMAFWDDKLYVGGANMSIGGLNYADLAYWDGSVWHQAGSGFDQAGTVSHIAALNNELFVFGDFSQFNGVNIARFARWDGTTTRQVQANIAEMQFMQASSKTIYIGGKRWVNESKVDTVAAWDGTTFQIIASGEINPLSLKVINDQLYGVKKLSATSSALMRWNGSTWVVEINAIPFVITSFAFDADQFYAESWNGTNTTLHRYTNQTWQPLTNCGCSNATHTVYLVANRLFIASTAHKPLLNLVGNQWQEIVVKTAIDPHISKIAAYQDDIYLFSKEKRVINNTYTEFRHLRSWENNVWKTIYQLSATQSVIDMKATNDNGLYFVLLDTFLGYYDTYYYQQGQNAVITLPRIGFSEIYKLFVLNGNQLYAIIPGTIYRWNGIEWVMSSGLPYPNAEGYWLDPFSYQQQLHLLTNYGLSINNRPLLRIFRRDGTTWIDQNVVLEGYLSDSAANLNGLYITGEFYHNNQVYRLVHWDGTQLRFINTLGAVVDGVAAEGNNLYVGGLFNRLPGCVCYNLGYWNGILWQPVNGGTNGRIKSMVLTGEQLYLTGWFSQTGTVAAVGIGLRVGQHGYNNSTYLAFVSK